MPPMGNASAVRARILDFEVTALSLDLLRYLHWEIFSSGAYAFIAKRANPFILDCGSNIGISILFFKALYPQAEIIGFEPSEPTHAVLQKNINSNALDRVQVHQVALGGEDSTANFYYNPQDPSSLAMSTVRESLPIWAREETPVQQVKLSRFIDREVDFLKLDIEGAEDAVLEELVSSGAISNIDQMVVEYHLHIDQDKDVFSGFLAQLEESGFGYQLSGHYLASERASQGRFFQCVHVYAYRKSSIICFDPEVHKLFLERLEAFADLELEEFAL